MNSRTNKKTYRLALSGVCLAFVAICVSLASIVPGGELTLYAISGIFTGIVISEIGLKGAVIFYIGALLLSFLLSPNKFGVIPYLFFFGVYGFIKYFAEKKNGIFTQMIIKIGSFILVFAIAFNFFREVFFSNINLPDISIWILAIMGIVMFLLYDYIYTLAILIYNRRVKRVRVEINLSGEEDGNEKR